MSDQKKKETMDSGYTSFTREDINQNDNRNTKAEQIFLEILDIPKRVQKKVKKGKEHKITEEDFYPTSINETIVMEELLNSAEAAVDDPSDTQFMNNLAEMRGIINWSKKRQWKFAYWIAGCVFIMAFYYFYQASNEKEYVTKIENWTEEEALKQRAADLEYAQKETARYLSTLNNDTVQLTTDNRKYYEERLEKTEEEIKIMQDESWEKYRDMKADKRMKPVWTERWAAIWCLIWVALYIIAIRPYGYMISKRRIEMKIYGGLQKALFVVAGAFFGAAASLKVTEYITHWSDGSKTRSNDAIVVLAMQIFLVVAAVLLVFWTARIIIVIATILGFIRNYDLIGIVKQIFVKKAEPQQTA